MKKCNKLHKLFNRFLVFVSVFSLAFSVSFSASAADDTADFGFIGRPYVTEQSFYLEIETTQRCYVLVVLGSTTDNIVDNGGFRFSFSSGSSVIRVGFRSFLSSASLYCSLITDYGYVVYYNANDYIIDIELVGNIVGVNGYGCGPLSNYNSTSKTFVYGEGSQALNKLDDIYNSIRFFSNSSYSTSGSGLNNSTLGGIQYLRGAISNLDLETVYPFVDDNYFSPAYIYNTYGSQVALQYPVSYSSGNSLPVGKVMFLHFSLYFEDYEQLDHIKFTLTLPDSNLTFYPIHAGAWDNYNSFEYLGTFSLQRSNSVDVVLEAPEDDSFSNFISFRIPIVTAAPVPVLHSDVFGYYYNYKIVFSSFSFSYPPYSNPDSSISSGIGDVESGEEAIVSGAQGSYDSAVSSGNSTVLNFFNSAGNSLVFVKTLFNNLVSGNIYIIVIASIMLAILPVLINVAGGFKK